MSGRDGNGPRLAQGAVIGGRFVVERQLGQGGMGEVYAAKSTKTGRRVALKLLHPDAAQDAEVLERFKREARIAAQLKSKHIVRVEELGRTEKAEPFIVMELLEGRDLDALIAEKRMLSVAEATHLISDAAIGVAAAHAAGLVHRDLKPANLFLDEREDARPTVKVLDFGLSKVEQESGTGRLTRERRTFGTPLYMSPEQCVDARDVDARSDQHALGVILYELLTKRPPYEGANASVIATKIISEQPPSVRAHRSDVPVALDEAIQRALAKKRADRFTDVGEFVKALAPFGGSSVADAAKAIDQLLRPSVPEVSATGSLATLVGLREGRDTPPSPDRFWIGAGAATAVLALATGVLAYLPSRAAADSSSVKANAAATTSPVPTTRLETTAAPSMLVTPSPALSASPPPSAPPTASLASQSPLSTPVGSASSARGPVVAGAATTAAQAAPPGTPPPHPAGTTAPHAPSHQLIFQVPND